VKFSFFEGEISNWQRTQLYSSFQLSEHISTTKDAKERKGQLIRRLANACTALWRELFTRASFLIGFLIGQGHKQGD
jgi:hypothetical protein